jgi:hypothetical protein
VVRRLGLFLGVVAICGVAVGCGSGTPSGFDSTGRPTPALSTAAHHVAQAFASNDIDSLTHLAAPPENATDARLTLSKFGGHPTTVASISMGPAYGAAFVHYNVECSPSRPLAVSLALDWVHGRWRTVLYGPLPAVKSPPPGLPQPAQPSPSYDPPPVPSCT